MVSGEWCVVRSCAEEVEVERERFELRDVRDLKRDREDREDRRQKAEDRGERERQGVYVMQGKVRQLMSKCANTYYVYGSVNEQGKREDKAKKSKSWSGRTVF